MSSPTSPTSSEPPYFPVSANTWGRMTPNQRRLWIDFMQECRADKLRAQVILLCAQRGWEIGGTLP